METSKLKTIDTEVLVALKKEEQKSGRSQLEWVCVIYTENIVSPRIKEVKPEKFTLSCLSLMYSD